MSTYLASCSKDVSQPNSCCLCHGPARTHVDLATYLATVMVGLFDRTRLAVLQALADHQKLGNPNVVARALLAQNNSAANVAANMPSQTYTTGSGIFRFAWRAQQKSTTIVHVPAAACCVLLAQPAQEHAASSPVGSCLSRGCAQPLTTSMLGGSLSIRSLFQVHSLSGIWLGSALGHVSWLSVLNFESALSLPERSALTGWLSGPEGGPPVGSPPSNPRDVPRGGARGSGRGGRSSMRSICTR